MLLTGQDSIREIIFFPTLKKLEEKEDFTPNKNPAQKSGVFV